MESIPVKQYSIVDMIREDITFKLKWYMSNQRIIPATLRGILMLVNTNCKHKGTRFAYSRIENVRDIMLLLLRCPNKYGVYTATTLYAGRLRPDVQPFTHLLNLFFFLTSEMPFSHTFHWKNGVLSTYLKRIHRLNGKSCLFHVTFNNLKRFSHMHFFWKHCYWRTFLILIS